MTDAVNKSKIGGGKTRNSSFELLRLVAMLLIVTHHIVINNANLCGYNKEYSLESDGVVGVFLNSMALIGVNLFVMISGWFGIKRIWPQVFRLVFDCMVYGLVAILVSYLAFGRDISLLDFVHVLNSRPYWFVWHFIILIMFSPIIETAIRNANLRQITYWVVLLTIVNIGIGYFLRIYNINGYNVFNFIYLYVLARWLRMVQENKWISIIAKSGLVVWVILSVLLSVGYIVFTSHVSFNPSHAISYYSYNNPLVMLSTVAVFLWFSQLKIQSSAINNIAKGALGIYLLHSTNTTLSPYRGVVVSWGFGSFGYPGLFLAIVCVYGGCLLLSLAVEWVKGHVGIVRRVYAIGQYVEERVFPDR